MIYNNDITVIFQGHVNVEKWGTGATDGTDFLLNLAKTRQAMPEAKIILSTWDWITLPRDYDTAEKLGIDELILNPDPGGLPNIKLGYEAPNNVNRQIVTTQAGLTATRTSYALKLRTDSFLTHDGVINEYSEYVRQVAASANKKSNYSPIVVVNFFTIDPSMFEHMAYHVSDWAQFGETTTLREYWQAEHMLSEDASYFKTHPQFATGEFFDNQFRTRLAVEQHITTQFAAARGFTVPNYYNELTDSILADSQRFLAQHIVILSLEQFGLSLPKYNWASYSGFMAMNCINNDDWYELFAKEWQFRSLDNRRIARAQLRRQQKQYARQHGVGNETTVYPQVI